MQNVKWFGCWVWIVVAVSGSITAASDSPYLQQLTITGKVEGTMARSTINLLAANPTARQRSGSFELRLPKSVAVDLAIWVDGVRVRGEVEPNVRAEQIYNTIVSRRMDPALLRQTAQGVYSLDIFPIPSKGTMRVEVTFVHLLNASKGEVRYAPPQIHSSSMDRELVEATRTVQHGSSPAVVLHNKQCKYTKKDSPIWKSVSYPMKAEPVAVADGASDGLRSFVFHKSIRLTLPTPTRPTVVLVDASESMGVEGVRIARMAAERILASRAPGDPLQLIVLQDGDVLTYDLGTAKSGSAKFKEILSKLKPNGGTDVLGGVTAGIALAGDNPESEIFVISDGDGGISYHQDPIPAVRLASSKKPLRGTIHVFSPTTLPWAVRRLAKHTQGISRSHITKAWQLDDAISTMKYREKRLRRRLEVKQCIVTLKPANKQTTLVDPVTMVRATTGGLSIIVSGRVGGTGELTLAVQRTGATKASAKRTVDLSKGAASPKKWVESLQGRYWVEDRFRWLQRKDVDDSDYVTFNGLMELAWQLHIVTKCTAMLALEGETMYAEHSVRRSQPANTSESPWARTTEALAKQLTLGQVAEAREKQQKESGQIRKKIHDSRNSSKREDLSALEAKLKALGNRPDLQWPESVQKQWCTLLSDQKARKQAPSVSDLLDPLEGTGLSACLVREPGPVKPTQAVLRMLSTNEGVLSSLTRQSIKGRFSMSGDLPTSVSNLAKQSTVPIKIRWHSICEAFPEAASEQWDDILEGSLSHGLDTIIAKAQSRGFDLSWTIAEGQVLIDTQDKLNSMLVTRAYPIKDMLRRISYLSGRYTSDRRPRRRRGGGGLFDDSGDSEDRLLDGDSETEEYWHEEYSDPKDNMFSDEGSSEDIPLTRWETGAKIRQIIKYLVDCDTWYPNGHATIEEFGGSLLINQTPQNHRKVERLLTMVRRTNPQRSTRINGMPTESLLDRYRRLRPWVATLLKKAREGKLGKYSSIKTRTIGKTIYARIGGVWMDTHLESGAVLTAIEPNSVPGGLVIPCLPIGDEIHTFGPLVIHALDGQRGYALESGGLSDAKDPRFTPLLKAIQAAAKKKNKPAQK